MIVAGGSPPLAGLSSTAGQAVTTGTSTAADSAGSDVYIVDDRVVAIRRDPVPPGAYGGQDVDYAPGLTAWVLGDAAAQ